MNDSEITFPPLERRSALWSMLVFPFSPRRAVMGAAGIPLWRAYAAHLLVLLSWPVVFILLAAYAKTYNWPRVDGQRYTPYAVCLRENVGDVSRWMQGPDALWVVLLVFGIIEVVLVAGAVALLPWGAQSEPLGETFRRSLRTVWLSTLHGVWWLVASGVVFVCVERAVRAVHWSLFDAQTGGFMQEPWNAWWIVRHQESLIAWGVVASSVWWLWALLRGVGAATARWSPAVSPLCEYCGYSLVHVPANGRCSECGTATEASLGPDARRAPAWEESGGLGFAAEWFLITREVLLRPKLFFSSMPVRTGRARAKQFCMLSLVAAGAVSYFVWLLLYYAMLSHWPRATELDVYTLGAVVVFAFFLFSMSLGGGLAGLAYSYSDGRNQMPAAAKVIFYTAGAFVIWMAVDAAFLCLSLQFERPLWGLMRWIVRDRELAFWLAQLGFHIVCFCLYLFLTLRAFVGVRYANR